MDELTENILRWQKLTWNFTHWFWVNWYKGLV